MSTILKEKRWMAIYQARGKRRGFLKIVVAQSLMLALCGCGHLLDTMDLRDETVLPPAYPIDNPPPPKTNGAIYQPGFGIALYQDHVAGRIGDIITVRLEEATTGAKEAKTKATKVTVEDTNYGSQAPVGSIINEPYMLGQPMRSFNFNTGTNLSFDGKGDTNQYNKLQGTISVTVTRVLSNGNLVVQGESWITINQGREYVRLSGILRPEDVGPTNTVSSQRLADARISYSGSGLVGNSAKGGLLTQFFYKFFPY